MKNQIQYLFLNNFSSLNSIVILRIRKLILWAVIILKETWPFFERNLSDSIALLYLLKTSYGRRTGYRPPRFQILWYSKAITWQRANKALISNCWYANYCPFCCHERSLSFHFFLLTLTFILSSLDLFLFIIIIKFYSSSVKLWGILIRVDLLS